MDQENIQEVNDIIPENLRFVTPRGKNDDGYKEFGIEPKEARVYWGAGKKKVLRNVLIAGATLSSLGLLGNTLLGKEEAAKMPVLESIHLERLPAGLSYSFEIKDLKGSELRFRVESEAETLWEEDYKEVGSYSGFVQVEQGIPITVSFLRIAGEKETTFEKWTY